MLSRASGTSTQPGDSIAGIVAEFRIRHSWAIGFTCISI